MKKQIITLVALILLAVLLLLGCSNNERNDKSNGTMDKETIKIGKYFGEPNKVTSSFIPILTLKSSNNFNLELGIDKSIEGTYRVDINRLVLTSSNGDSRYMLDITNDTLIIEQEIPKYVKKSTSFKLAEKESNTEIISLSINYIENKSGKRFVEKKLDLLALPVNNSIKLNAILENTVVMVLDTANVNNSIWLYVAIPIHDSPTNYKGWIKESETVPYTKDRIDEVQGEVIIKKGVDIFEAESFEDIKAVKPYKSDGSEHGRIQEKKDGYFNIQCAGGRTIWVNKTSVVYPEVD